MPAPLVIPLALLGGTVIKEIAINVASEFTIRGIDKLVDSYKEVGTLKKEEYKESLKSLETKKMEIELSKQYANVNDKEKAKMLKAADEEINALLKKSKLSENERQYEQAMGRIIAINNKAKITALNDEEKLQLNLSQSIIDRINTEKYGAKQVEESAKAEQEAIKCSIAGYSNKRKAQEDAAKAMAQVAEEARKAEEENSRKLAKEFEEEMKRKEDAIKNLAAFDEKMRIASLDAEAQKQAQLLANYQKQKEEIESLHEAQLLYAENEEEIREEQYTRLLDMETAYQAEKQAVVDEYAAIKKQQDEALRAEEKNAHAEKMREEEELRNLKLQSTAAGMQAISTLTEGHKEYAALYKASAIGEATINAVQSVLKTMAGTPYPFNIPLAAAQSVAAAVNVSKIASTKMYRGGMIPGKNTLIMANEEGREAILNPMAVRAVGGAAGVNALNQGTYNNTYDNSRSSNNTFVIKTAVMTQKTFRDEIEPVLKRAERRR